MHARTGSQPVTYIYYPILKSEWQTIWSAIRFLYDFRKFFRSFCKDMLK